MFIPNWIWVQEISVVSELYQKHSYDMLILALNPKTLRIIYFFLQ